MNKITPEEHASGKSTEHKHEHKWVLGQRLFLDDTKEIAVCIVEGCNAIMASDKIECILSDYDRLKRATDALTAEDALEAEDYYSGVYNHTSRALRDYARILSEDVGHMSEGGSDENSRD